MKKGERKSIFTADDFGATEFINMGTNRGIEKGLINSVAVMVNFPGAIDNIADLKKKTSPHIPGSACKYYGRISCLSGKCGSLSG
jgi:predicted glycoside hydrolase/deacetylase ChbG (UPF0249 family)